MLVKMLMRAKLFFYRTLSDRKPKFLTFTYDTLQNMRNLSWRTRTTSAHLVRANYILQSTLDPTRMDE